MLVLRPGSWWPQWWHQRGLAVMNSWLRKPPGSRCFFDPFVGPEVQSHLQTISQVFKGVCTAHMDWHCIWLQCQPRSIQSKVFVWPVALAVNILIVWRRHVQPSSARVWIPPKQRQQPSPKRAATEARPKVSHRLVRHVIACRNIQTCL